MNMLASPVKKKICCPTFTAKQNPAGACAAQRSTVAAAGSR